MAFSDFLKSAGSSILSGMNPLFGAINRTINPPTIQPRKPTSPVYLPQDPFATKSSTPQGFKLPTQSISAGLQGAPSGLQFGTAPGTQPGVSMQALQQATKPTFSTPVVPQVASSVSSPSVTVTNPQTGESRQVTSSQAAGFMNSGWTTGGTPAPQIQQEPSLETLAMEKRSEAQRPAIPQIDPKTQQAYDSALRAYEQSLRMTPEELATQEDLDRLIESTRKGYQTIQDQTIPMGFITGQLQSLEQRALNLAEPLQQKLARLQAARTASLEASKFAIEQSAKKLEREEALATQAREAAQGEIREFGGQLVRVLPDGRVETLAQAPAEAQKPVTLGEGQILVDPVTGERIAYNPKIDAALQAGGKLVQVNGQSYIQNPDGTFSLPNLPGGQKQSESALQMTSIISDILADPGLDTITGAKGPGAYLPYTAGIRNNMKQLAGLLSLESREKLKGSGAISDFEAQVLANAASNLGIDENGRSNLPNDQLRQELLDMKNGLLLGSAGINPYQPDVKEALRAGFSAEQIIQFQQSFNNVGGDTNTAAIRDGSRVITSVGKGVATGIQSGSDLWKYGFDIQYDGGKGAPVYSPVSGTVIRSGNEGDFGNRVRIRLADGRVIAAAHLDQINVKPGTKIAAGQMIGTQGNTGKTLGPTGIHVDWTLYGADGRPRTSQEAASFLGTRLS